MPTTEITQSLLDTCYSLQRVWWKHWPLRRGKGFPMTLAKRISAKPIWVELEPHVKMLLDPSDLISNVLLLTGEWEPGEQAIIQQYLIAGDTFVDVGAHIGYCSLKAATLIGANGRVIAIEANPETVRKLRDNVAASAANVTVEAAACSDSETTLEFFTGSQSNSGSGSISKDNAGSWGVPGAVYSVQARPLDAILEAAKVSKVDVVKIDVEGAELKVLKGGQSTLAKYHPVLLIELEEQYLNSMGTSSTEVKEFLQSYNYSYHGLFDNANYVFTPSAWRQPREAHRAKRWAPRLWFPRQP